MWLLAALLHKVIRTVQKIMGKYGIYHLVEDDDEDDMNEEYSATTPDFIIKRSATIPSNCETLLIIVDDGPGLIAEHIISLSSNVGSVELSEHKIATLYLSKVSQTIVLQFDHQKEVGECSYNSIIAAVLDLCKPDITCVLSSANIVADTTTSKIGTLITSRVSWSSSARCAEIHNSLTSVCNGSNTSGYSGMHAAVISACEARGIAGISFVAQKKERLTAEIAHAYETLWPLLSKMGFQPRIPDQDVYLKFVGPQDQFTARTGNLYT